MLKRQAAASSSASRPPPPEEITSIWTRTASREGPCDADIGAISTPGVCKISARVGLSDKISCSLTTGLVRFTDPTRQSVLLLYGSDCPFCGFATLTAIGRPDLINPTDFINPKPKPLNP